MDLYAILILIISCVAEEVVPPTNQNCTNFVSAEESASEPDIAFPITSFSCWGRYDGYYADVEVGCAVFHYCQTWNFPTGQNKTMKWDFYCPESTIFNQGILACTPPSTSFNCQDSPNFYWVNYNFTATTPVHKVPTSISEPVTQPNFQPGLQVVIGNAAPQITYLDNFNDVVTSSEKSPTTQKDFNDDISTHSHSTNMTNYDDNVASSVLHPIDSENVYSSEFFPTNWTVSANSIASSTSNPTNNFTFSDYFGSNTTDKTNHDESISSVNPHSVNLTAFNYTTPSTQIFYETNLTDFNLPVESDSTNITTANDSVPSSFLYPTDSNNYVQINENNLDNSFSPTVSHSVNFNEPDIETSTSSHTNSDATATDYSSSPEPEPSKPYSTDLTFIDDNRQPLLPCSPDSDDAGLCPTNSTVSNDNNESALSYPTDPSNSLESTTPNEKNETSYVDSTEPSISDQSYQESTVLGLVNETDYTDVTESDKPNSSSSTVSNDTRQPLLPHLADSNDIPEPHPTALNDSMASDLSRPTNSYNNDQNTGPNVANEVNRPDGVSNTNVSDFNEIHSPASSHLINSNDNFEHVAASTASETDHVIDPTNLTDFHYSILFPVPPKPNPAYGNVFIVGNAPAPYQVGYFGHNYYFVPTGSVVTGLYYYPYSISPAVPYATSYYGLSNYVAPPISYPMHFSGNGYSNVFSVPQYPVINSVIYRNKKSKS